MVILTIAASIFFPRVSNLVLCLCSIRVVSGRTYSGKSLRWSCGSHGVDSSSLPDQLDTLHIPEDLH